jgi:crotonobetainyl-CoA:carnitine CoA-transferase CaiB-like acyl-CoA transferase
LEAAFASLTVTAVDRLEQHSVPCGRVRSVAEAMADPQISARDMLLHLDVPGHGDFRVLGNPIKMSGVGPSAALVPPRLGQHTSAVLQSLGYTDSEISAIADESVPA